MMRGDLFRLIPLVLIGTGSAFAQVPDPTRPADVLVAPAGGGGAAAGGGVQVVILRSGGKSVAVINGQHVEVGGKLGDRRVLNITENEVVLKGESGREVIKATPAIEKMPVMKKAAGTGRKAGSAE